MTHRAHTETHCALLNTVVLQHGYKVRSGLQDVDTSCADKMPRRDPNYCNDTPNQRLLLGHTCNNTQILSNKVLPVSQWAPQLLQGSHDSTQESFISFYWCVELHREGKIQQELQYLDNDTLKTAWKCTYVSLIWSVLHVLFVHKIVKRQDL